MHRPAQASSETAPVARKRVEASVDAKVCEIAFSPSSGWCAVRLACIVSVSITSSMHAEDGALDAGALKFLNTQSFEAPELGPAGRQAPLRRTSRWPGLCDAVRHQTQVGFEARCGSQGSQVEVPGFYGQLELAGS